VTFSPENGRVYLSVRRSGDTVEFAVADEGPGIPPDFVDTAFDGVTSFGYTRHVGSLGVEGSYCW